MTRPTLSPDPRPAPTVAAARPADVPGPADVRDMAIVHRFYRREFALAPQVLRALRPQDTARRAAVKEWFPVTLLAMHHHHEAEDELMFPLMTGRVDAALLERMELQHRDVAAAVDEVETRLAAWTKDEPGSLETLADAYDRLLPVLVRHLDDEEREVVPLIAGALTAEQYGRKATSGNDRYEPRLLMMCFGAMIEQCSAEDAEFMLSHLRDEVRRSWDDHVADEYRELMSLLRGDLWPAPPTPSLEPTR